MGDLERQVARLVDRLAAATPAWYAAKPYGTPRNVLLRELVRVLADLGRRAGSGAPDGAEPPVLGDHALAYQLVLLAHEVAAGGDEGLIATAVDAVRSVRDRL